MLLYRGYPIEQLAERSNFLEICYLLLYGELPGKAQWDAFNAQIRRHTMVHEGIRRFIAGYQHDAHPMGCWSASWVRSRPSTTTPSTSVTRSIASWPRSA